MEVDGLQDEFDRAETVAKSNPADSIALYKAIIFKDADDVKIQEQSVYSLADVLVQLKRKDELKHLQVEIRPVLVNLPKAKTAKIVRTIIDYMAKIPGTEEDQINMCTECITWCASEKRTFLRRRVETRLCQLYLQQRKYEDGLALLATLLRDVKKLDDKLLLVEIHLIETKTHFAVEHMPKAKAALTACKTNANAIHCPPLLQAEIDMWSGVVNAHEKDYRTAYSYLYEALEAFSVANDPKAFDSLKYLLLMKIMLNLPQECKAVASSKAGLKYEGAELTAILAVAQALEQRSLTEFESVLKTHRAHLDDSVIQHHMSDLNESILEENLLRIVEPFSKVEVEHVAKLIKLPLDRVQAKLSEMILDKKLLGTLDQGQGALLLYDQDEMNGLYGSTLTSIKNTQEVLDSLYKKAMRVI
jgi:26S proteasome regulatory subunit N6